jgi:tRNA pseudouridine38-40 synthase
VHASGQVVCFSIERPFPPEILLRALNALTPRDITIDLVEVVADEFDPRRLATSRVYAYSIWNAQWPSPFWRRYAWHVRRPLDLEPMCSAARDLLGEHDFSTFRAAGCDAAHPRRRVLRSTLERVDERIVYTIEANAFLRCMVRNIVGTLVQVGAHVRPRDDVARILAARDRDLAGPTAPPHGLCLTRVNY